MLDYPYFPDLRGDSLSPDNGITANLGQLTMNWAAPIRVGAGAEAAESRHQNPEAGGANDITDDSTKQTSADDKDPSRQAGTQAGPGAATAALEGRLETLLQSSPDAWTNDSINIQPDFAAHGALGFPQGDDIGRKTLAVAISGPFESAFAGRPSPLLEDQGSGDDADADLLDEAEPLAEDNAADSGSDSDPLTATDAEDDDSADAEAPPVISAVVERSPEAARLILIGSSSFLTDTAISLASEATQSGYLKPLELIENALEWSLEDRGLLSLRGRGQFSRMLAPVGRDSRMFWEYLNYVLALGGLVLVYVVHRVLRRRHQQAQAAILEG